MTCIAYERHDSTKNKKTTCMNRKNRFIHNQNGMIEISLKAILISVFNPKDVEMARLRFRPKIFHIDELF